LMAVESAENRHAPAVADDSCGAVFPWERLLARIPDQSRMRPLKEG
jgi:hypothetical protein